MADFLVTKSHRRHLEKVSGKSKFLPSECTIFKNFKEISQFFVRKLTIFKQILWILRRFFNFHLTNLLKNLNFFRSTDRKTKKLQTFFVIFPKSPWRITPWYATVSTSLIYRPKSGGIIRGEQLFGENVWTPKPLWQIIPPPRGELFGKIRYVLKREISLQRMVEPC